MRSHGADAAVRRTRRVLILNWRDAWHPEGGGSELYLQQVARRLRLAGHDVTVFTAAYPGARRREDVEGIHYVRRGRHISVYLWAIYLLLTGRLGRPDAILEVQNGIPFLATWFSRAPVTVLVHHVHREQWPVVGPALARFGWFMESRVAVRANRGNRYVAVSDTTRLELIGLGVRADDIDVAYNGLPPQPAFESMPRSTEPRLVVLSRLVPHKQIEHAMRAVARLRAEVPGLHLRVMGSGWWHDHLLETREGLHLEDCVEFLGHVSELTKYEELSRAWVNVLPSIKEGWGLSIVEAASVGVPSVAYQSAGGVQESILDGVTGLLATGEADLTDCLRRLLRDPELLEEMGEKAAIRAAQFTWDNTAAMVMDAMGLCDQG